MATPHLGVRSSAQTVIGRVRNGMLRALGNVYGGATLEQMTLTDKGQDGKALMLTMSLPGEELPDRRVFTLSDVDLIFAIISSVAVAISTPTS